MGPVQPAMDEDQHMGIVRAGDMLSNSLLDAIQLAFLDLISALPIAIAGVAGGQQTMIELSPAVRDHDMVEKRMVLGIVAIGDRRGDAAREQHQRRGDGEKRSRKARHDGKPRCRRRAKP